MKREILISSFLVLVGCASPVAQNAAQTTYNTAYESCVKRINVTLTPAEYEETEKYRSKIDPDLDDKVAIQAVYERKRASKVEKCRERASQEAQAAANAVNHVSLPVVFVAPLY